MITDHIKSIERYKSLGERISKGLTYIQSVDFSDFMPGQYEIEGDEIFAIVNEYKTNDPADCLLESHRRYIDIQYIVNGSEMIGYAPLGDQRESTPYNAESDITFFEGASSLFQLEAGMFAIFFPTDLHMPGVGKEQTAVRKVVIKVKV